jgi:hypothetical protein
MIGRRSWRLASAVIGVGLAAALGFVGCSSKATNSNQSAAGVATPGAADAKPQQGADTQAHAPTKIVPEDRAVIYTGSVTVGVSDVDRAADAVAALATGAGGYLGGDQRTRDDRRSRAQLVLRVPAARFASVVDSLAKLGTEVGRSISTQDVTDQVVDLDARISTGQASVDRVRALLARAQNIGEIVSLESEMSRREADLESLKARKRKLSDLTELSTITVVLQGPDAMSDKNQPQNGFLVGLKGSWRAFVASLQALLTVIGAALPWLLALGIPAWILIVVLRRMARRRAGRPAPANQPAAASDAPPAAVEQ